MLSKELFHGTTHPFNVGDIIKPRRETGVKTVYEDKGHWAWNYEGDAFATTDPSNAKRFADERVEKVGGTPRVFKVEPLEDDFPTVDEFGGYDKNNNYTAFRSSKGFRVVGEHLFNDRRSDAKE